MCRTQLGKLQQRIKEVEATGAAVFGVSIDTPEVARKLRQDLKVSYPILSDPRMEVVRAYRMKGEGMQMGDMGYVIVDRQGKVRAQRIDRNFADHLDGMLETLRQVRAAS